MTTLGCTLNESEPGPVIKRKGGRVVENDEYAKFLQRGIRAMGRRAGSDVDALVLLRGLEQEIGEALAAAVEALHEGRHISNGGFSYGEIAQRLGVTRQAVQKRWGKPGEPLEPEEPE